MNINDIYSELEFAKSEHEIYQIKSKYMQHINIQFKNLSQESLEIKKTLGSKLSLAKSSINEAILKKLDTIKTSVIHHTVDITLPTYNTVGSLHTISITMNRAIKILTQFGFSTVDGPEIEDEYHNFEALNIAKTHPARRMQDSFYINQSVLRTHTSSMQIRYLENSEPPIKIISAGRVYRVDMDATHSPMFHQLEMLWVDKLISFANLKSIINDFLSCFFEKDIQIRFRASYFPFTEPSAEIDIYFNGKWLEVGGAGVVHPNVLKNMSNEYKGIAFGIGIDRLAMILFGIDDLREMFENNLT